jgi:uncharacterized membrane protein
LAGCFKVLFPSFDVIVGIAPLSHSAIINFDERRRFDMKSIKDILLILVALAAAAFAVYRFYLFAVTPGTTTGTHHLWWAIGATIIALVCGLFFFLGHVNKEEEIHITQ